MTCRVGFALGLVAITGSAGAAEPPPPETGPLAGALSPKPGSFVINGGAGMVFALPHVTLGARLGSGFGTRVELVYRNLAAFGHMGEARIGWGTLVSRLLALGVVARTSIMTLSQADGSVIGIQFSDLALGNDWEAGGDLVLTWLRPGRAQVTAELGTTWTLGGERYVSFDEREFQYDTEWRSIDFALQVEWLVRAGLDGYVRLDGMILTRAEVRPLGFLPTWTAGVAWAP